MGVPEVGAGVPGGPLVPEGVTLLDGALGYVGYSIGVLRPPLPNSVPVDGHCLTLHHVVHVDNDLVILADLDARSGDHAIRGEDASLDAVREDALTVAPDSVCRIGRTYLACSETS